LQAKFTFDVESAMSRRWLRWVAVYLGATACLGLNVWAQSEGQQNAAQKSQTRVSANAVFAGSTAFIDAVKGTCQDFHSDKLQDCFAREMKKAGASPEAVEFSKQLGEPGFVRDFKKAGVVDIAYVFYPYRANENQSCLIVNGEPAIIDIDNHTLVSVDSLKGNSRYLALMKRPKDISLWPGDRYGTETPEVDLPVDNGVRITVNYRLREQCHACAVLGHAWFEFDFDEAGKFRGAKFAEVSLSGEKAAMVRQTGKTVVVPLGEEVTFALPVRPGAGSEWTLAKPLDDGKLWLIEHSHVAPPTAGGAPGADELWKFAAHTAGTTEIEFQRVSDKGNAGAKPVRFKVTVRAPKDASR
jgi:predicted secreted protein